jgi:DNA-binding LacI/PurR family transcriptional regulator
LAIGDFVEIKRVKSACFELSRRRIQGYLDVLGRDRAEFPPRIWESPCSIEEEGRLAAEQLLTLQPRPTAILTASDRLAIGVIETAKELKLRVPQDVSVVGFDDIPSASLVTPRLTTTRQPLREKGRLAVASLLEGNEPIRRVLPTGLIIRDSTGPGPAREHS